MVCVDLCSSPLGRNNHAKEKLVKINFCFVNYYTHYTNYDHYFDR